MTINLVLSFLIVEFVLRACLNSLFKAGPKLDVYGRPINIEIMMTKKIARTTRVNNFKGICEEFIYHLCHTVADIVKCKENLVFYHFFYQLQYPNLQDSLKA